MVQETFCFELSARAYTCVTYTKSFLRQYLTNRLEEFLQIYNFGAVGDKDQMIRSWAEKVKGQGHSEATWSKLRSKRRIILDITYNAVQERHVLTLSAECIDVFNET